MDRPRPLAPDRSMPVPAPQDGWWRYRHAALGDGSLAILSIDVDLTPRSGKGAQDDKSVLAERRRIDRLVRTATARLSVLDDAGEHIAIVFPLERRWPAFDRLPDGSWVVAHFQGDALNPCARRFDIDGRERARFHLGNGIEHLKSDAAGRLWVGWMDQGVYGNQEWTAPGRAWPPSGAGWACFDTADGALRWSLDWRQDDGVDPISDCYALATVKAECWTCTYTGFPLRRSDGVAPARRWTCDLAAPSAIGVAGSRVWLAGGYPPNERAVVAVDVTNRGVTEAWRGWLDWPGLGRPDLFDGREDTLHVVADGVWHRWRVR